MAELSSSTTKWTGAGPNPCAASHGFVVQDGTNHVIYRRDDGDLEELFWTLGAVSGRDLTSSALGAPSARGLPSSYLLPSDQSQHVIYRSLDNHLHELTWGVSTSP